MFSRLSAVSLLAIPLLASAIPQAPVGNCSTGQQQCCNSVQNADSASIAGLLSLFGIVLQDVTGQVGVTCSPVTIIGAGGASCNQQTVCCSNNNFNGIIALGCTPLNLNA